MLEEMIGQKVVVDLRSPFVCLGTLLRIDAHYLELRNADLHDLRDTDTHARESTSPSRAPPASSATASACCWSAPRSSPWAGWRMWWMSEGGSHPCPVAPPACIMAE